MGLPLNDIKYDQEDEYHWEFCQLLLKPNAKHKCFIVVKCTCKA